MYPDPASHSPPNDRELSHTGGISKREGKPFRKTRPKTFWALVISVVALLFLLLAPVVKEGRLSALRSRSNCSLKIIGSSTLNYDHQQSGLPPHTTTDPFGTPLHGWETHLLPYLDAESLHSRIDFSKSWDHPDNANIFKTPMAAFSVCGEIKEYSSKGYALTTYAANSHLLKENDLFSRTMILDGTSNTIMYGEIGDALPPWGEPGNIRDPSLGLRKSSTTFGGLFEANTCFSFADGRVRYVSNDIDPEVLKALATPAAGDDPGEEFR